MLAVTVCAVACYWIARPTLIANRLVTAIESQDFKTVDELLIEDRDWATDEQLANIQVELQPLTSGQLVRGERWFSGYVPRGENMEDYDWWLVLKVTRSGVETYLLLH